jgi:cell division protein FtsZ
VQGISDIILTPGIINLDFSDIRATRLGMGHAMMGTAIARGENAVVEAARQAINCPLLEDTRIAGSRRVLINLTGSSSLGLHELNEACSIIREAAQCEDVHINLGVITNDGMGDAVKATVIATGFRVEESKREEEFFSPRENSADPAPVEVAAQEATAPAPDEFDPFDLEAPAYLRNRRLVR